MIVGWTQPHKYGPLMNRIPAYVRHPKNITKTESLARLGFYFCNTITLSTGHRNAHSRDKQHKNFIETLFRDKGQKFVGSKKTEEERTAALEHFLQTQWRSQSELGRKLKKTGETSIRDCTVQHICNESGKVDLVEL